MPRQTTFIKPGSTRLTWRHVDASGKVLGRLATQVATVLMGKHRPDYTPNVDCGEAVVVTNASEVTLTGRKADQKTLRKWSGYPGGLRVRTYRTLQKEDPCTMVEEATGVRHENKGHYLEFEPPHRLVGGEQLLVGGDDVPDFRSVQEFTVDGDGTRIHIEQFGLPAEFVGNPMVIEAFRSSYRKLGRLLGVETQERDCA